MSNFQLLVDDVAYLKTETQGTPNTFVKGILVEGTKTISYVPFECIPEPYSKGETSLVLPSGVSSRDAYILFTSKSLKTHDDLKGTATVADIVYLENPEDDQYAHPYVVFDHAPWKKNGGFQLLGGHGEYLIIRQEKVDL